MDYFMLMVNFSGLSHAFDTKGKQIVYLINAISVC